MVHAGSGSAPVYFHRDSQPVGAETPFYYVSFGRGVPSWIDGSRAGIGGGSDEWGIHERVEGEIGPEYERLTGPGKKVRVGTIYWDADRNWRLDLRDPSDVHAVEGPTYMEEQRGHWGDL